LFVPFGWKKRRQAALSPSRMGDVVDHLIAKGKREERELISFRENTSPEKGSFDARKRRRKSFGCDLDLPRKKENKISGPGFKEGATQDDS